MTFYQLGRYLNRRIFVGVVAVAGPFAVFAGDGDPGEAHGIPAFVGLQAINFILFAALLFFFLRKPVASFFSGRKNAYRDALAKAQAARAEAEFKRQDIQARLDQLEATAEQTMITARAEAEALKAQIIAEAQKMAQHLRKEAQMTAQTEAERAKQGLRDELLAQAVELSRKMLSEKMAEPDQKRLQSESLEKIQVVR